MKKALPVLLALLMLFSLTACGGNTPAEESTKQTETVTEAPTAEESTEAAPAEKTLTDLTVGELDDETFRKAILAVATAFYNKNPDVQYEAGNLNAEADFTGALYRTTGQTPEDTEWDSRHYSQCSEFCFDVYLEAMGFHYLGDRNLYGTNINRAPWNTSIVLKWTRQEPDERENKIKQLEELAEPGDIFLGYGSNGAGHVILLLGDTDGDGKKECLHCWPYSGGNLDEKTGQQKPEANGSAIWQTMEDALLGSTGSPNWGIRTSKNDSSWYLLRPRLMEECQACHLTPATVSRMEYEGLTLHKKADANIFQSITEGQDLVVTETVTNNGPADYKGLSLVEYVPEGAVLKTADPGSSVNGREMKWTLDIPAGQTVTLTYTVTNQLKQGETLVFGAGMAANIPTRTFSLAVGGKKLTALQNDILKAVSKNGIPSSMKTEDFQDLDFLNRFYSELLGVELKLPKTFQELLKKLTETKKVYSKDDRIQMLAAKESIDPADEYLRKMILKRHFAGFYVTTGPDILNRVVDIRENYYEPGDIFLTTQGIASKINAEHEDDIEFFIYLGNSSVLSYSAAGPQIVTFNSSISRLLVRNILIVLRPTLCIADAARDDIQMPVFVSGTEVTTEAELKTALEAKEDTVIVKGDITVTGDLKSSYTKLVLDKGGALHLGDHNITVGKLQMEGGVIDGDAGRVTASITNDTLLADSLRSYLGNAVVAVCAFEDISNSYDCLTMTASYTADSGVGAKNFNSFFSNAPEGFTLVMHNGLVTNSTLNVKGKGLTVDINGCYFGVRTFSGEKLTLKNSKNTRGLYFRGTDGSVVDKQTTEIYAPGVKVTVGWSINSTNATANVELSAKLTCGELAYLNGSKLTTVGKGEVVIEH